MDIWYNYLNLPETIYYGDGKGLYQFTYTANGMKLSQKIYNSTRLDYIGPFVYKNGSLDYIITSEGRAVCSGGNFSYYEFYLKYHLGNIRTVFKKGSGGGPERLQTNDY
jgi:hypothetical protein